jgi:hypothetical protein
MSTAAWAIDTDGYRRNSKPGAAYWYTGIVITIQVEDDGAPHPANLPLDHITYREECSHRHHGGTTARACAEKRARRMGWARPRCDCGATYPGTRAEALKRGWSPSTTDPLGPLTCADCIISLCDQILDGFRQHARR